MGLVRAAVFRSRFRRTGRFYLLCLSAHSWDPITTTLGGTLCRRRRTLTPWFGVGEAAILEDCLRIRRLQPEG